jgi:REP element-mobilizing transposase RayT
MNRRVDRTPLFESRQEYDEFASLLGWAQREDSVEITSWCLMPNHWHLVLRPDDPRQLSSFMHRLETTHAVGFRSRTGTRGHGSVYGGRFKSFPIPADRLLRSVVYVERNPVKAGLVQQATAWRHGSAADGGTPNGWPNVTRLPTELERLRSELLTRPLPEEFEREFARWCTNGGDSRRAIDGPAMHEIRARLDAIDQLRRNAGRDAALQSRRTCAAQRTRG